MSSKVCSKCKQDLPLDNFYKASVKKNGHTWTGKRSQCKTCMSKISSDNYREKNDNVRPYYINPLPKTERRRNYRKRHREAISDYYIKTLIYKRLHQHWGVTIKYEDIPQELIDTKRKLIQLERKIYNR
jgi:hypothetical protein|tara:strand:- start:746 stop:1132 length:387 start_codon:yes stop_codon:yes gene_type:complete